MIVLSMSRGFGYFSPKNLHIKTIYMENYKRVSCEGLKLANEY